MVAVPSPLLLSIRSGVPHTLRSASYAEGLLSWQAVTWVLEHSQSIHSSRLVLLSIASHANREGRQSYPSVETICIEARLGRRAVQYCLRELEQLGELKTIPRTMTSNSYELPFVESWLGAQSLRPSKEVGAQIQAGRGRKNQQKGAHTRAHEPFPNHPLEPYKTEPEEKTILLNVGEPSKTTLESEEQAEVQRLKAGRGLTTLGRKLKFPKSKSWEEQKAEMRMKGLLS